MERSRGGLQAETQQSPAQSRSQRKSEKEASIKVKADALQRRSWFRAWLQTALPPVRGDSWYACGGVCTVPPPHRKSAIITHGFNAASVITHLYQVSGRAQTLTCRARTNGSRSFLMTPKTRMKTAYFTTKRETRAVTRVSVGAEESLIFTVLEGGSAR